MTTLTPTRHTVQELSEALLPATLPQRVALARQLIAGRLVFTTSLGLEDQAITHAIFTQDLAIDVVTLDSGRLFPETYDLWGATEERYGRRILGYAPGSEAVEALIAQQGINGFRHSVEARKTCCHVRKVEPLGRALAGAAGWITGLRAQQSRDRADTPLVTHDASSGLVKVNPLADWSRQEVAAYVADHAVPYNPLHDRGFPSIGCAPCTRAVKVGEPERAGRWWWENETKKECGLHRNPVSTEETASPAQR
jgi:phosphoadenosine phosphosulfate reductase